MLNTRGESQICFGILKTVVSTHSKAEGLIVALSGDLERPLVGQSGTFVEAGSSNLISVQVESFLVHCCTLSLCYLGAETG